MLSRLNYFEKVDSLIDNINDYSNGGKYRELYIEHVNECVEYIRQTHRTHDIKSCTDCDGLITHMSNIRCDIHNSEMGKFIEQYRNDLKERTRTIIELCTRNSMYSQFLRKYSEMFTFGQDADTNDSEKYSQLVDKYNTLVRKYNELTLRKTTENGSTTDYKQKYDEAIKQIAQLKSDNTKLTEKSQRRKQKCSEMSNLLEQYVKRLLD